MSGYPAYPQQAAQAPGYPASQQQGQAYQQQHAYDPQQAQPAYDPWYDNYAAAGAGAAGYGYPPGGPGGPQGTGYPPAGGAGYYGQAQPMGPPRGRGGAYGPANRWAAVRLRGLPFGVLEHEINMFLVRRGGSAGVGAGGGGRAPRHHQACALPPSQPLWSHRPCLPLLAQGLDSVDVLLVRRGGRATGEAFVLLPHPADLDAALRKNRAYMGSRYIEVFEAGRQVRHQQARSLAFLNVRPAPGGIAGSVLLPSGIDPAAMAGRCPVSPMHTRHYAESGVLLASSSPQDYYKAVAAALGHAEGTGGRAGSPEGGRSRSRSPGPGRATGEIGPAGPPPPNGSVILKLRGLPFSATALDVVAFFDDPALGVPPVDADK